MDRWDFECKRSNICSRTISKFTWVPDACRGRSFCLVVFHPWNLLALVPFTVKSILSNLGQFFFLIFQNFTRMDIQISSAYVEALKMKYTAWWATKKCYNQMQSKHLKAFRAVFLRGDNNSNRPDKFAKKIQNWAFSKGTGYYPNIIFDFRSHWKLSIKLCFIFWSFLFQNWVKLVWCSIRYCWVYIMAAVNKYHKVLKCFPMRVYSWTL